MLPALAELTTGTAVSITVVKYEMKLEARLLPATSSSAFGFTLMRYLVPYSRSEYGMLSTAGLRPDTATVPLYDALVTSLTKSTREPSRSTMSSSYVTVAVPAVIATPVAPSDGDAVSGSGLVVSQMKEISSTP